MFFYKEGFQLKYHTITHIILSSPYFSRKTVGRDLYRCPIQEGSSYWRTNADVSVKVVQYSKHLGSTLRSNDVGCKHSLYRQNGKTTMHSY
jgi:hypothetical protein